MLNTTPSVDFGDVSAVVRAAYDERLRAQIQSARVVRDIQQLLAITAPASVAAIAAAMTTPALPAPAAAAAVATAPVTATTTLTLSGAGASSPVVERTAVYHALQWEQQQLGAAAAATSSQPLVVYYELSGQNDGSWEQVIAPFFGVWHSIPFIRGTHYGSAYSHACTFTHRPLTQRFCIAVRCASVSVGHSSSAAGS